MGRVSLILGFQKCISCQGFRPGDANETGIEDGG